MAEQIVYDIKFNGAEEAQKGLEAITKLQIEQQDVIKQTKAEIKDYEKALSNLNQEMDLAETVTDEQLQKETELRDAITQSKVALAEENDTLKNINKERRTAVTNIDAVNTAISAELGSNEQLKAQLKILTQEYNLLGAEERENTETGQQLTEQINAITSKLKDNEKAIGDNRRNVGNYEEAVTNALGKVNLFGVNLGQVTTAIKTGVAEGQKLVTATLAQAEAQTAAATASRGAAVANGGLAKSLNVVKVALASTGIGLIVVALGALVGAFASTQRGADAFSRVITPIKFVLQGLLGVLQDVSFILVDKLKAGFDNIKNAKAEDIFKNIGDSIKENLLNRIEAFSIAGKAIVKILKGDLKEGLTDLGNAGIQFGTGIEDGIGKISNAIEKTGEAYEKVKEQVKQSAADGKEFANAQIAAEQAQIRLTTAIAQTNKDLKEQRLIASDQTKTDQERIQALEEATKLTTQKSKQEKELVNNELKLAQLKAAQNDTDRTAYLEIAQLKAKLIDLDAQAFSEQRMIYSQLSGLQKTQLAAEQKRLQSITDIITAEEEKLKIEYESTLAKLELDKLETDLTDEELQAREQLYTKYTNSISELRLKTITEELADAENLNVELEKKYYQDLLNAGNNEEKKKQLTAQYNKDKLTDLRSSIQSQIQIINSELEPLLADADGGIADSILSAEDKEELEERLKELQKELAKTNYEYSKLGVDPETGEKQTMGDLMGLSDEEQKAITAGYQTTVASLQTILTAANDLIAINTEKRINTIDEAVEAGTKTEEEAEAEKEIIRKESFEKQKKLQIAQATISFAQGLIGLWSQSMSQFGPVAGAILGAIGTAALTATYGVNLASIKAQNYAEGGYVQGPGTGTSDSIPANLSNGEYVQKQKAVRYYGKDFMDSINSMQLPKYNFASGGLVTPTPINNVSSQVSKGIQPIAEAVKNSRTEIINVESRFSKLQKQVSNVEKGTTY